MTRFLDAIARKLPDLIITGLAVFVFFGAGILIVQGVQSSERKFETCIAAGMQWNRGDCVK